MRTPTWLKVVLIGSMLWLGVALTRGVTFALTHAQYGVERLAGG